MADSKSSTSSGAAGSSKTAPEPAPASNTLTSGAPVSNDEVDLRREMARLNDENRDLRARLEQAGAHVPEARELSFDMSEGVRQDLILLRHRVKAGELKEEDAVVADPASGRTYTLSDIPADAEAIPGVGGGSSRSK